MSHHWWRGIWTLRHRIGLVWHGTQCAVWGFGSKWSRSICLYGIACEKLFVRTCLYDFDLFGVTWLCNLTSAFLSVPLFMICFWCIICLKCVVWRIQNWLCNRWFNAVTHGLWVCTFPHVLFSVHARLCRYAYMKSVRMTGNGSKACDSELLHSNAPRANALNTEFKPGP